MTEPAVDTPVVLRDVFPAEVLIGGTTYRSALAVVTRDRLLVYAGQRQLVLDEPYDPAASTVPRHNAPRRQQTTLALADGRTAVVRSQRGCACGSPMKAWRPWSPWRVGA